MKTIIAGGRDYVVSQADYRLLDQYRAILPITEVCSGCATGADRLGEIWAEMRKIRVVKFSPMNLSDELLMLPFAARAKLRNQHMADYADALIAFPGGFGTADMVRRAKVKGLTVIIVKDPVTDLQAALGALRAGE